MKRSPASRPLTVRPWRPLALPAPTPAARPRAFFHLSLTLLGLLVLVCFSLEMGAVLLALHVF